MSNITNIDDLVEPTHDEHARQRFVSVLRKHVTADFAQDMRTVYDDRVAPAFEKTHGRKPATGMEIRKAMKNEPIFQEWTALSYNAQQMTWWSVQPSIERRLPELVQSAKDAARATPAGGTLRLNPDVVMPKSVSDIDIHLMPGSFAAEHGADDVAQGALYHHGTGVFAGGIAHRTKGGWGATTARYFKLRYPEFAPKAYLDIGCTVGRELFSVMDVYPDAQTYAVDVGAPVLRYAHARAEAMGKTVHFSQQNAETLDFDDATFDLITTSFFFHEISVPSARKILREAYRVLKPGGLMINQEMPPSSFVKDPYYDFATDTWNELFNNEPHVRNFRQQDLPKLFAEAGFAKKNYVEISVPNYGTWPDALFEACVRGDAVPPEVENGQAWYSFGAWK
ncbi:MAG: class I SAM-dependent methyltransferase [Proteobacteria bacterium]|nr:class I SAM-dependent methyltransferase [Pseudomonadota bacterium]MDA1059634.1 class I SAM-dependent methyltransferase [Pseudomonadota bacterium]